MFDLGIKYSTELENKNKTYEAVPENWNHNETKEPSYELH